MSISDKIVAAEEALEAQRDKLLEVSKQYEEAPEQSLLEAMNEQTDAVENAVNELESYRRAEKALAVQAASKPAISEAPAIVKTESSALKEPVDYLLANALVTLESHVKRLPWETVAEQRFGENEGVTAVRKGIQKYTDTPPLGTTFTPGWAQELTRDAVGQFLDLLTPESIVPRLPLQSISFGGANSIKVPFREADPTMDADFLGEGDPIPVKYAGLGSKTITMKKMGCIGTYKTELFERSTPNILNVIRDSIVRDSAIKIDAAFLSDLAASDIQPPGMQSLAGTPIDGSGMTTQDGVIAVIKQAVNAMTVNMLGARPAWIMHPTVAWSLQMMQTAVGSPAFPEMANGQLVGIPVLHLDHRTCRSDFPDRLCRDRVRLRRRPLYGVRPSDPAHGGTCRDDCRL